MRYSLEVSCLNATVTIVTHHWGDRADAIEALKETIKVLQKGHGFPVDDDGPIDTTNTGADTLGI